MNAERWLLPDGIEALLPPLAWRLERLRRRLLDLFYQCGYDLVIPPMLEHEAALRIGTGHDLELDMFKVTDPQTGRPLGIRPDITPQVARIDAHFLKNQSVSRLCYLGSALRTQSDGLGGSRNPFQIGAEIFGHPHWQSDLEIICLLIDCLEMTGIREIHLDLGHGAIFPTLIAALSLDENLETDIFDALQRKDRTTLTELLQTSPPNVIESLLLLTELHGAPKILERAREQLPKTEEITTALDELNHCVQAIHARYPTVTVGVDLAELRGYRYHTGLLFSAYGSELGRELARGGRYDNLAQSIGHSRPATGFSADLKMLAAQSLEDALPTSAIAAPWPGDDAALFARIRQLRNQGERVLCQLPNAPLPVADRRLVLTPSGWVVVSSNAQNHL